jgi:hypothetical protein
MGRPPLHMKPTQVRLSKVVRDRITDLVGEKGMAAFIRRAVERELEREAERSPTPSPRTKKGEGES